MNEHRPALIVAMLLAGALLAPLALSGYALAGPPKITGTASPMTIDETQSVSFTSNPTGGKLPYTLSWTFGDGGTSTLQNPSHTYNSPGTYTASVTVTDKDLKTATWTSGPITVNVLPNVTGTATPTTIDETQSVAFTCTPSNGTSPYTYLWNFGDGSSGSTSQNPSHTYNAVGVYAASVTMTDSVGKSATWITVVTVNTLPNATGTASPTTIDATQNVSFTCTPSGGTTPYTYSWAFGDGGTSALQNPSYTYNNAGNFTASVTVTDLAGKTATWTSGPITVNALPNVTGTATPTTIDVTQSVSFTCSPSGGTSPLTYSWNFGDGGVSAVQNPSHVYNTAGIHTVRVTVTDSLAAQATWSVLVTVNSLPSLTGTAAPTTIDVTQSVSFTCAPSGGTSPFSYFWDFGDGSPLNSAQNPSHVYASVGSYTVNVTAIDAVGEEASWTVNITVNPLSSVTGTATPTTIDATQSVTFGCTPNYGTPPYTYNWTFGDGGTSTQRNLSHVYNTEGVYTANVTVTDSVAMNASWTIVITVNALPSVTGTAAPTIIDSGQIVSFTSTPENGTAPYAYSWDFDGAPGRFVGATTNESQSPFYEFENLGSSTETYNVTITVTDAVGMQASWTSATITVYAMPSVVGTASPEVIDSGQIVSFTCVASFGSGVYPSYLWAFGDDPANTSTDQDTTHQYDSPGSYNATVTVTDSLSAQAMWTVVITVNPLPSVTGTASPTMIDATQSVSFTCTPSQGSGSYSYLWSFGDGPANTSTDRNTTHEYDQPGSYIVSLTVTDSLGEQATWTVDITVNPMLRVTGTSATALDVGQTVNFTSSPSYGTTPYTYSWTFGDGGTSSLQNPSHTYSSPGLYTSEVTVTDAVGGQSSWTVVILVNALPSVTGTATPTAIDSGQTVYFTCTPSNGTGSYTFLWIFGDGSPGSTAQSPAHIYASEGSYTVNVTATDDVGEQAIWTVVITVNAPPTLMGTATPTAIDANQSVSFTCTPDHGTPPYTYSWAFGDDGTSDLQNPSYIYTTEGTYTVNVTVTDSVGRDASWTAVITVYPPPSVTGTATPTAINTTETVQFACVPGGGIAPYTYSWTFGDGSTSTIQSPDHTYTDAGTYAVNVTVTDAAGQTATWSTVIEVNGSGSGLPLITVAAIIGAIIAALTILFLLVAAKRKKKDDPRKKPMNEDVVVSPITIKNEPARVEQPIGRKTEAVAEAPKKIVKDGTTSTGKMCPLCLDMNDTIAPVCRRCGTNLK